MLSTHCPPYLEEVSVVVRGDHPRMEQRPLKDALDGVVDREVAGSLEACSAVIAMGGKVLLWGFVQTGMRLACN